MKKFVLLLLVSIMSITSVWATATQPSGSGTAASPYQIASAGNLEWFRDQVNAGQRSICAKLTANIDLSTVCSATLGSWTPIGSYTDSWFTGTFDGAGFTISNLYINALSAHQALFGCVMLPCVIKNLTVNGEVTSTAGCSAGIVGRINYNKEGGGGTIDNCVNNCKVTGTLEVGGIAGYSRGTITNCTNNGNITGSGMDVAGIAGNVIGTTETVFISQCRNTGAVVNQSGNFTGGIAGSFSNPNGSITQCINIADVDGYGPTGGICGYLFSGTVGNCISAAANISTTYHAGAIVGVNNSQTISNCHYSTAVTITENGVSVPVVGVRAIGTSASATNNTGDTEGETAGHDAAAFSGGEVAYLFGSWCGQDLASDVAPTFLATDGSNKVLKVTFNNTDNSLNCTRYATTGKAVYNFPSLPGDANKWVVGTDRNGTEFMASSTVTTDGIVITAIGLETDTDGAYLIGDAEDLTVFRNMVNGGQTTISGKLTANIDLSTVCSASLVSWTPIGNESNMFAGTFDGGGFTISNLYINANSNYQGLFGYANRVGCAIKNITVSGTITSSNICVAGIVGHITPKGGTIENCVNNCSVTGRSYIGGIAGHSNATITNCTNNGTITAAGEDVGGIVGRYSTSSAISRCRNTGDVVNTSNTDTGGIAGIIEGNGSIMECINTGNITGSGATGGICGYLYYGSVINCISTAKTISSKEGKYYTYTYPANAGAIVGVNPNGTITNCRYLNTVKITEDGTTVTVMGVRAIGTSKQNTKNTGDTEGVTAGHADMASGEVAYLLGNTVFGQNLGTDAIPTFLAADGSNKVLKASVYRGTATGVVDYMNCNSNGADLSGNDIAVTEDATSVESLGNNIVIKFADGYEANAIELVDAQPFYTPCEFTAKTAVFTPTLTPATRSDEAQGSFMSNTLTIVPFDGYVMSDGSDEGLVFNQNFWVKSFSGLDASGNVRLVDVENGIIPAHTPIFLAGATHQENGKVSFDQNKMTIYGENVTVSSTATQQQASGLTMQGTYTALEVADVYQLDATGRALELKETATIAPFGAYFTTTAANPAAKLEFAESSIPTGTDAIGSDETAMKVWAAGSQLVITSPQASSVDIYTIDGTKVIQVDVEAGKTVIDTLLPGYYIVNHTKVAIK